MIILVTNDDGVHSPGLAALARALRGTAEVYVVAPDRERSAASHSLTLHKPLRADEIAPRTFAVSGTPTDCVTLGINALLPKRPDAIFSGINMGANVGDDVTYSGTVSAAMEGTILGIPSVALSLAGAPPWQFTDAARVAVKLARQIARFGLPAETLLNVNVPNRPPAKLGEVRITRQGRRVFRPSAIVKKLDPRGRAYYWIGENRAEWHPGADTDHAALEAGAIAVTPIHLDLTRYPAIDALKAWEPRLALRGRSGIRPARRRGPAAP
jgi:5'-nucleotidase